MALTVVLARNDGTVHPGETLDLTARLISQGSRRWEADQTLTKFQPSDAQIEVSDHDGTVWNWLQAGPQLPPWLLMDEGGVRVYSGLVDRTKCTRTRHDGKIRIPSQDWSRQLWDQGLTGPDWQRPQPKSATTTKEETRICWRGHQGWEPQDTLIAPYGTWIQVGDLLRCAELPGKTWKVASIASEPGNTGRWWVPLPGLWAAWDAAGLPLYNFDSHWTRLVRDSEPSAFYSIRTAVGHDQEHPVYALELDTTDGIYPCDGLQLVSGAKTSKWRVLQLDPQQRRVHVDSEVRDVAVGERLYFDQETLEELVATDARRALQLAARPWGVDLSRFQRITLPSPVMAWLPMRPAEGADLLAVSDLEPLGDRVRVRSGSTCWEGMPESGWTAVPSTTPTAWWSDHMQSAPASLPTDDGPTLAPGQPSRCRARDWKVRDQVTGGTSPALLVTDCAAGIRHRLQGTSMTRETWSAGAWGNSTSRTWPGAAPVSACPVPGQPGALLGLTSAGLLVQLDASGVQVATGTAPADAAGADLRTTPWGAYLVGPRGYGLVTRQSAQLTTAWVTLAAEADGLQPSTFAAVSEGQISVLARYQLTDPNNPQGTPQVETWHLRLAATPTPADARASVLSAERVLVGAPITCGACRLSDGRVIGHVGGRLYQVSNQLPWSIDRFTPGGMSAGELIEHVCQLHGAVAVPDPLGVLHIISRAQDLPVVDLAVDVAQTDESPVWEHWYSEVTVTGEGLDGEGYAVGRDQGGKSMEMTEHPLIETDSTAQAVAESLAAWFGKQRRSRKQMWIHVGSGQAPWAAVEPLGRVRVNGEPTIWRLMGLDYNVADGKAVATLVEA